MLTLSMMSLMKDLWITSSGGDTSDGEQNHNLSLYAHKVKENSLIQKLAVLIPAIKLEMMNEEINFNDIVPFQVKKAEGLPKTKLPFNCGLFVVKMLECRSLGLKKMSSINDDTAMDLRSKLCCEMFDQFMDKDFQEGYEGDHSVSLDVCVCLMSFS
ncbi:hypothetical protein Bca52824_086567 [Brassica carinata]|uniref:Ubiquitin-like protease family profile domain-containing protein n=1 Tax=Brassica carinata TaxID=52824 RepID=A0A8X7PC16_BRACI|nr:hypothetical protein Bca52824_086567 [Brassica carinata]